MLCEEVLDPLFQEVYAEAARQGLVTYAQELRMTGQEQMLDGGGRGGGDEDGGSSEDDVQEAGEEAGDGFFEEGV